MVDSEEARLQLPYAHALHGNPSLAMKPFDECQHTEPEYRAGPLHDKGDAETGTQLIGKGLVAICIPGPGKL